MLWPDSHMYVFPDGLMAGPFEHRGELQRGTVGERGVGEVETPHVGVPSQSLREGEQGTFSHPPAPPANFCRTGMVIRHPGCQIRVIAVSDGCQMGAWTCRRALWCSSWPAPLV